MEEPKIILKVELESNHDVKFTILDMHYSFITKFGEQFVTKNKWRILIANDFQVVETLTILPELPNNEIYHYHCNNETMRYKYLKSFSDALIQLSELTQNKNEENFAIKSHIKTQGNMWLVY